MNTQDVPFINTNDSNSEFEAEVKAEVEQAFHEALQEKRDIYITKTINTLLCQFLFTFGCMLSMVFFRTPLHFVLMHMPELLVCGSVGGLISILYIVFSNKKTNFQLGIFTLFETMVVCVVSLLYDPYVVLMAMIATIGIVGGLSVYALTTKNNHLNLGSMLSSGLSALLFMGILNLFFRIDIADTIYLYFGTIVFLGYIVYDVQLYFSKQVDLMSDDKGDLHITAALNIYLDVVNIFVRLLDIINRNKSSDKPNRKQR